MTSCDPEGRGLKNDRKKRDVIFGRSPTDECLLVATGAMTTVKSHHQMNILLNLVKYRVKLSQVSFLFKHAEVPSALLWYLYVHIYTKGMNIIQFYNSSATVKPGPYLRGVGVGEGSKWSIAPPPQQIDLPP